MNRKSLLSTGAALLASAAGASLLIAGIVSGPIERDNHAVQLASATGSATPDSPYFYRCGVVAPRMPVNGEMDCVDPGHELVDLFWTDWNQDGAIGTGRLGVASGDCEDFYFEYYPDSGSDSSSGSGCEYIWYPVEVSLDQPTLVRYGNAEVFGQLTVKYTEDRPAGEPAEKTFALTGPGS